MIRVSFWGFVATLLFATAALQAEGIRSSSGESIITSAIPSAYYSGGTTLTLSGLTDNDINGNIIKAGVGELIISNGTNNNDDYWKGTTTISGGTLAIKSDTPDPGAGKIKDGPTGNKITILSPGTLSVPDFSEYTVQIDQAIDGTGTIENGSAVFRALDATVLSSGNSVGTLTVDGNYKIEYPGEGNALGAGVLDTGPLKFELPATSSETQDQIDVTGDLTMQINSGVVSQLQIEVQAVDGLLDTASNYTLIKNAGTLDTGAGQTTATGSNFSAKLVNGAGTELATRYALHPVVNNNSLELEVSGTPLTLEYVSGGWQAGTITAWDSKNDGVADETFQDLDSAVFSGGVAGSGTVEVFGTEINAFDATFNSDSEYVIGDESQGTIKVLGSLNQFSAGTTQIKTIVTTPTTIVEDGTLAIGARGSKLGKVTINQGKLELISSDGIEADQYTIKPGGRLVIQDDSKPISVPIAGSGEIVLHADGANDGRAFFQNLSGFTGDITVINDHMKIRYDNDSYKGITKPSVDVFGDMDDDGVVNPTDLARLTLNWQKRGAGPEHGDCNGDGVVNHLDLQTMADNWLFDNRSSSATGGQGSNPSGAIAVFYRDISTLSSDVKQMAAYQGDNNGNGSVTPTDLSRLTLNWLTQHGGDASTDDGHVGNTDSLADLTLNWLNDLSYQPNTEAANVGPATIPEPTSVALLVLGGLAVCRRRRR